MTIARMNGQDVFAIICTQNGKPLLALSELSAAEEDREEREGESEIRIGLTNIASAHSSTVVLYSPCYG